MLRSYRTHYRGMLPELLNSSQENHPIFQIQTQPAPSHMGRKS
jgi:hypothetical protein